MTDAFIYDAVRTPRGKGKKDGALHSVKPVNLMAGLLRAVQRRNDLDTAQVDDIVLGCVTPVGDQGADIAKTAALVADWDEQVAGVQINRFCASGLEAVNLGAMKVRSGFEDLVLVGGVESMSRVPMGSDGGAWALDPETNLHTSFVPQGIGADLIATLEGFSRADVDAFALRSQQKAAKARAEGLFGKSLVPVADQNGIVLLDHDEFIRADSTLERARRAQTEFRDDGADGLRRHRAAQVQPGRAHRARAYAGQQLGDRRRRQRHAHWLRGQGPRTGPEGAGADRRYRGDLHRPHHHAYRPRAATRKALAKAA